MSQQQQDQKAQQQKKQKAQQVLRHVYVQDFLKDEEGAVTGVKGVTWPDRISVNVVLDYECDKAKNAKRMDFAKLAKGFKVSGHKYQLEKGGILRMRTIPIEEEKEGATLKLKTDWINVVSYNKEQTTQSVRFGLALGKTKTPSAVWQKREEIRKSPSFAKWLRTQEEETGNKVERREYNEELERRLANEMPGQLRYFGEYFVYSPDKIVTNSNPQVLRDALVDYFSDPDFTVRESEGGRQYRPIKPHLIIRGLNDYGEFTKKRLEFMPQDADNLPHDEEGRALPDKKTFKSPEECAEEVMANLPKGCASWSIMPAKVYTHSLLQMEMSKPGENNRRNEYAMSKMYELNSDCHQKDENGEVHPVAFPMGIKLSSDDERPCVVETIRDYRLEAVDPVMIQGVKKVPGQPDEYLMFETEPEPRTKMTTEPDSYINYNDSVPFDDEDDDGLVPY